jgi:cell division protease FtsH
MKLFPKNLFVILAVLALLIVGAGSFYSDEKQPEEVSLNTVAQQVKDGRVSSIAVQNGKLTVTLQDGTLQESRKEGEASITESLVNYGVDPAQLAAFDLQVEGAPRFQQFLPIISFLPPLLLIGLLVWFMMRSSQRGAGSAFSFGQAKAKMFGGAQGRKQNVTFADVAGEEESIEELKEIVEFLKTPERFTSMGARIPKGVMLMGPPGTGKTLLARAVSGEAGVPFYSIAGSEFVEMFVGVGASRVRDLFENAKKTAPSIIFIDEIDAVGRLRGAGMGGGNDEREQTLNQILSEMDGFEQGANVIVIAATNRPDVLDPALLRPGRFDRRILIDLPDMQGRESILKLHTKDKPFGDKIDLKLLAARTPGFAGADLSNLVNEAAIFATRRGKKSIDQQELYDAIEKVLMGPERKSRIYTQKDKEVAAYHEAGHALVADTLPHSDPVHKISIISRGRAGGYTMKVPDVERSFKTFSEFEAELAVMLGGYTAEQFKFNELTTGASDDLQRASDLARRLITRYGMSTKIGPVVFGEREEAVFLGKELGEHRNYSEDIARTIDEEVKRFIAEAHETARRVIEENREKLERIATTLIEKETLEKNEFDDLMKARA